MRKDPRYAAHIQSMLKNQQSMQQGNQLAQAYAGVEQSLMDAEAVRRKEFENTPSDVPIPMRAPEYKAPSPLEQWKERNSAMMASGNPALQKIAMENMAKIQEESLGKEHTPSTSAKIAMDLGYKPGTKAFNNFVKAHAMKSGTTVNIGSGQEGKKLTEAELKEWGLPPGSAYAHTKTGPKQIKSTLLPGDSVGKLSMLKTAQEHYGDLDKLIKDDGTVDKDIINVMTAANWTGDFSDAIVGKYDPELLTRAQGVGKALEYGIQGITRLETGAAMPQEEIDNTRTRFMPKPFDTDETVAKKIKAYKYFIDNAVELLNPRPANIDVKNDKERQALVQDAIDKAMKAVSAEDKPSPPEGAVKRKRSRPKYGEVIGNHRYIGGPKDNIKDPKLWIDKNSKNWRAN